MRGLALGGEPWGSSAPPASLPPPYLPELSTKRASGLAPTRRWPWPWFRVAIGCSSSGSWLDELFVFLPRPPVKHHIELRSNYRLVHVRSPKFSPRRMSTSFFDSDREKLHTSYMCPCEDLTCVFFFLPDFSSVKIFRKK